jgi:hypothetical protein
MKLNQLTDSESRASKYALECLKAEARLGEATRLLRDAVCYLRPGELHDAAYKDFSRRFAEFLRASDSGDGSKK